MWVSAFPQSYQQSMLPNLLALPLWEMKMMAQYDFHLFYFIISEGENFSIDKESACNAGDPGSIPGSERSPAEGNGNPLQYSSQKNPTDRWAWQATVHGAARVGHNLVTKPPPPFALKYSFFYLFIKIFLHFFLWTLFGCCHHQSLGDLYSLGRLALHLC